MFVMSEHASKRAPAASAEMVRITKAKAAVDISSNTIRAFQKRGLPLYKIGRATFFSRSDLEAFLRRHVASAEKEAA